MVEYILSLPDLLGGLLMVVLCTVSGLAVYLFSYKIIAKYQSSDLKDPASCLFRLVGILVSLVLSLAFGQVVVEWRDIQNAIKGEIVALTDISIELQQFGTKDVKELHQKLIEYTKAVIDDDWPALAQDQLGKQASLKLLQLIKGGARIGAATPAQEALKNNIQTEIDRVTDFRLARLNNALAQPPVYAFVTILGFLIAMACFGVYRPQGPLVCLVTLYTSFVGIVLYLILTLSDPFQGFISIEPDLYERLVDYLRTIEM